MVTEFVCKGDLLKCLREVPKIYNFEDFIFISGQVAAGMSYLEKKVSYQNHFKNNII